MKNPPEKIWFAVINMGGGLHTDTPIRGYLARNFLEDEDPCWYDKSRNRSVNQLGLYKRDPRDLGYVTFASEDKKLVQAFCDGAAALRDILLTNTLYKRQR